MLVIHFYDFHYYKQIEEYVGKQLDAYELPEANVLFYYSCVFEISS